MRESKSGVIENGRKISFIEYHAAAIKRDIQRNLFISLAGPVCEVAYGGEIYLAQLVLLASAHLVQIG